MTSTIRYPIGRVINWYVGNFCTRKCFNKKDRIFNCHEKFELFRKENKDLMITHKEFKDLIDDGHLKICSLNIGFRRRMVGWKQFEKWLKDKDFDPDKFD